MGFQPVFVKKFQRDLRQEREIERERKFYSTYLNRLWQLRLQTFDKSLMQFMQKLRKALAISVMSVTVLSTSMFSVSFAGAATSIAAGDLIKTNSSSAVYYVGADMKKNVFPDSTTYFSWYSDFSAVTVVSQDEFNALSWGGNVVMRPGTKLVKIQSDPRVYAVEPGGKMKHIPSEAVAISIYGANWAKRVVDISDTVFVSAYDKNPTELTTAFPAGTLVKGTGADVFYFDGSAYRKVANEAAFAANRFSFANVVTTANAITASGADVTSAEFASVVAGGAADVVVGGTGLTVALSSATPEAGNAPIGASVDFLKFNVTASNDGAVNISSIKLSAFNLGDADDMTNVSFYDNGVKVGTSKTLSASDRNAVFNFATPIAVAAGTTKTLTVKATLAAGATSNYALGINAAADIVTGGAAVSGSFPVVGNTKSGVSATLGAFDFNGVETTDTSNKFGEDNVLLAAFDINATAAEDLLVGALRLRNGGTNSDSIVSNMRLVIDGEDVQTGVSMVDRYASFNAGNYVIEKGQSVSVEIYGDLGIGSANDTVGLYLKETTDISVVGKTFGYDLVATSDADLTTLMTINGGVVVTLTAGDFTIDMDKIATPAKDIRADSTNVVLATIKMTSNSENATLAGIGAGFTVTGTNIQGDELSAFELVDLSTGSIFDLTADNVADATYNLTMSDEVSFVKDVTKTFALRADVLTTADVNDVYAATLAGTALSLTGDVSDSAITNITPSSVSGANQTVKEATLSWATTSLTDKTVVTGAAGVTIYSATAKAGDVSPITITSVKLDVVTDSATDDLVGSFTDNNITKLDLYINNVLVKTISNGITEAVADGGYITFSSLDATKRVVAKGTTVPVEVKATFASSFVAPSTWSVGVVAAGSIMAKDDANATVTATGPAATGSRNVTLASVGTLKAELLTTDSKANNDVYQLAGSTKTSGDAYVAEVKLTAANEPVKVKTLVLAQKGTANSSDIKAVNLYNAAGTVVATTGVTPSGHAVFTNLALTIPADSAVSYFVGAQTKSIAADGDAEGTATYGKTIIFAFASGAQLIDAEIALAKSVEADGADSGQAITMTEDANATIIANEYSASTVDSKTAIVSGAILTSIVNTMTDGTLTGGAGKTIGKYKMVFDNGANRYNNAELMAQLKELKLTVATSSALVNGVQAHIDGASTDKTASVEVVAGEATINLSSGLANSSQVDGEITLVITGTVSGVAANAYVQTSIADLTTDFTYDGDGNGTPVGSANSLLPISEVIGATLSN